MARKTFKPTAAIAKEAAKGLQLREKFKRGGTVIGVARARDLKSQSEISADTVRRMISYFARHQVDKRAKNFCDENNPSAGYIAWLLWGGDAGRDWALKTDEQI